MMNLSHIKHTLQKRDKQWYTDKNYTWFSPPQDYIYVRESIASCLPNELKRLMNYKSNIKRGTKIIGYQNNGKGLCHLYWYLKEYDLQMPNNKEDSGYGFYNVDAKKITYAEAALSATEKMIRLHHPVEGVFFTYMEENKMNKCVKCGIKEATRNHSNHITGKCDKLCEDCYTSETENDFLAIARLETTLINTQNTVACKEMLLSAIKNKLNFKTIKDEQNNVSDTYDGFDMSGYGNSFVHNMEILGRFKDYFVNQNISKDNDRDFIPFIPIFWKGSGQLVILPRYLTEKNEITLSEDITGWSTYDTIYRMILTQNPSINNNCVELARQETQDEELFAKLYSKDENYVKTIVTQKMNRNRKLVLELKEKQKNCQICSFTFVKKDGTNYNEVHHIISLCDGGKDAEINTLVLCANCHRQLHFANVDLTKIMQGKIVINDIEKIINSGEKHE